LRRPGGAAEVLKKGRRLIPCTPSVFQELQRVGGAEADGAELIGGAEEIRREDVRRRPIEAPVWQRDAWVDRLQLAFEIEEISAVPGQKARRAMGLRRADIGVACCGSPRKRPRPWLLSCAKAATKRLRSTAVSALAFFRIRTIAANRAHQGSPVARLDRHVAIVDAGFPEFAGGEKRNGRCRWSGPAGSRCWKRPRGAAPEHDDAAPAADTAVIFRLTVGDGAPAGLVSGFRQGDGAQRRSGRWGSRCC